MAKPCLPDERLAITRTGSIGSWVGPAVTMTCLPASGPGPPSAASIAARIASGSGSRPGPYSPQAISPSSGSRMVTPSARSRATLRFVASCCHIRTFIAGAASTFLSVASSRVVARSSAIPAAIFASRSAVAGQTTTRSASRDSWIWPISASSLRSQRLVWTGCSDKAASVIGVTNWAPPAVSTQRTLPPALRISRISSHAL